MPASATLAAEAPCGSGGGRAGAARRDHGRPGDLAARTGPADRELDAAFRGAPLGDALGAEAEDDLEGTRLRDGGGSVPHCVAAGDCRARRLSHRLPAVSPLTAPSAGSLT